MKRGKISHICCPWHLLAEGAPSQSVHLLTARLHTAHLFTCSPAHLLAQASFTTPGTVLPWALCFLAFSAWNFFSQTSAWPPFLPATSQCWNTTSLISSPVTTLQNYVCAFVSQGCHNRLPQTGWFKTTDISSLTEVQSEGLSNAMPSLKALG